MSDGQVRELERRWRASGAVEDRVRWLSERVRAGRLTAARLGLAAHCDDPAALRLVEVARAPWRDDDERWLHRLASWGKEACGRAALATAQRTHSRREDAQRALALVGAWVACPCAAHEAEAAQLARALAGSTVSSAANACFAALEVVAAPTAKAAAQHLARVTRLALWAIARLGEPDAIAHAALRAAAREGLLTWALAE